MEEDYQRALEPSFTYVYGCCVLKHNFCGDQLEVSDCTLTFQIFFFQSVLRAFCAPMSGYPLETQLLGSFVERWRRSLVEVPPLGI